MVSVMQQNSVEISKHRGISVCKLSCLDTQMGNHNRSRDARDSIESWNQDE